MPLLSHKKPLCVDLYCGLGGWTEGFLAEGWDAIGFDIERHVYGNQRYPAQLVLQDVLTLDGRQFRNADCIVASPPCQAYSYRGMPFKRARSLPPPSNALFDACFRLQREASDAAGKHIPLLVENVMKAQRWVGKAAWHYGSFYLWGDVPAIMPYPYGAQKTAGNWFRARTRSNGTIEAHSNRHQYVALDGVKQEGSGPAWFDNGLCKFSSKSLSRKAASAQIAKIPFPLSSYIARCLKPPEHRETRPSPERVPDPARA